jgi:hypothetical protein
MTISPRLSSLFIAFSMLIGAFSNCSADTLERAAIAAHQDQLQNLNIYCDESRAYDVDPAWAAQEAPNFRQPRIDLKRTETSGLKFMFLSGNAYYDRETDAKTLSYWAAKGLPAIARQIQTITSTGRIEELTQQRLANGKRPSFGGLRQLSEFSPEITIDIAMGLRLLGGRQWLTKDDLNSMQEIQPADSRFVVLRVLDGGGHVHELRYDKQLLYALVYYRCTNSHGASVEIVNSDFHQYGSVFVPRKIVRTSNTMDSKGQIRHPLVFTFTVKNASINDPRNTPDLYSIEWPAHLQLFDARTNDRIEVGATTRPFSDEDIRKQLAEKRVRQLMLEKMTTERIQRVLEEQPTTRP